MSLRLHTSNRLERLAQTLAKILQDAPSPPFIAETIVVQSVGMARWLKLELAQELGGCIHAEFPLPRDFFTRVIDGVLGGESSGKAYQREVLRWRVYQHLGSLEEGPVFAAPNRYLADQDPLKRFQLASRVANLFDQYLVFRPDLIAAWNAGDPGDWQAELWRRVSLEIGAGNPASRRENAIAALLKSPPAVELSIPRRVLFFGMPAEAPAYLDLLGAVASKAEVHCFLLQPCAEWWGDIVSTRELNRELRRLGRAPGSEAEVHLETGNRLLASLGLQGRDFLRLIYDRLEFEESPDFEAGTARSILAEVQRDLLLLQDVDSRKVCERAPRIAAVGDGSVRIHNCHSPVRELEVLHDCILDWLNDDPTLNPRDIVVMTPQLPVYAPLITAVFGTPESPAVRVPFSVADQGLRLHSTIADAFLRLLRLSESRLTAEPVLDLLECAALRSRFEIEEADLPVIRRWVHELGIRWGRDEKHLEGLGLPGIPDNTWREGLRRLILGQAMAGNGLDVITFPGAPPVLPYDGLDGSEAVLAGRFAEMAQVLFSTLERFEGVRPVLAWTVTLNEVITQFFNPGRDEAAAVVALRQIIARFAEEASQASMQEAIPFRVLLEPLATALDEDPSGAHFLTGGVTFCELKPLRSIPFKVICLIGMNGSAFPREPGRVGFDWMTRERRLGDRSMRQDDRQLFLETIVSARQRLHISYVGQSLRDNSPIPPSTVVDELLDYVRSSFQWSDGQEEALVLKHPLHPFSPRYFSQENATMESPWFSYSEDNCRSGEAGRIRQAAMPAFLNKRIPEADPAEREIDVAQLTAFFAHPTRYLLQERLNIFLSERTESLEENEPTEVSSLAGFQWKERLTRWSLDGVPMERQVLALSASGSLPPGAGGRLSISELTADVSEFVMRLQGLGIPTGTPSPVPVALMIGSFGVRGSLEVRADGSLVRWRCGRLRARDLLQAWLEHLVLQASAASPVRPTWCVGADLAVNFPPVEDPFAILKDLLDLYWNGLHEPLRFFPETSLIFAEATVTPGKSKRSPSARALEAWVGNEFPERRGESEDPWLRLAFGHDDAPLNQDFEQSALAVFGPILKYRREVS
jgi:exodeoxyribonuclease V gamma subunit